MKLNVMPYISYCFNKNDSATDIQNSKRGVPLDVIFLNL